MNSLHIIEFCEGWLTKATTCDNTTINGVFDRYFTLFVTYNALYNHVTRVLVENGSLRKRKYRDKESATDNVVKFLGSGPLYATIQTNIDHVNSITSRLNHNGFYLHSKQDDDSPDYERDRILKYSICSTNPKESSKATLTLLYQLRCNLFHGEKVYHMNQINILGPANSILHPIIYAILSKLHNIP